MAFQPNLYNVIHFKTFFFKPVNWNGHDQAYLLSIAYTTLTIYKIKPFRFVSNVPVIETLRLLTVSCIKPEVNKPVFNSDLFKETKMASTYLLCVCGFF